MDHGPTEEQKAQIGRFFSKLREAEKILEEADGVLFDLIMTGDPVLGEASAYLHEKLEIPQMALRSVPSPFRTDWCGNKIVSRREVTTTKISTEGVWSSRWTNDFRIVLAKRDLS